MCNGLPLIWNAPAIGAINICEWVVYLVTAEYREFDSEYEMPRP